MRGQARDFQSARIRTAGPAVLRPRAFRHGRVGSPGQRGGPVDGPGPARAKTCRTDASRQGAANRTCAALACLASACAASACATSARTAFGAGGAALATATRCSSVVVGAGTPKPRTMPGTTLGLSHHSSPRAGGPARRPFTLPPNATIARASSGQSLCPGPMPLRRHIQAITLPKWPRIDAACACAEPAGRSGRGSGHMDVSRRERRRRAASACSSRKRISTASKWTSHSGSCADASGPARSASGA